MIHAAGDLSRAATEPPDLSPSRPRFRSPAIAALGILAILWGYNWVVMKLALHYVEPFTFSAMRTFLSTIVLFAVLVVSKKTLRPQALPLVAALGVLQTAGFTGLAVWALKYAGAGKTSVLVYIMPFWLLLLAWVFLDERLRGLQWVAIGVAFCGLVLIISPWRAHGGIVGDLMGVGAGLSWGGSSVLAKRLHTRHAVDLLSVTAWQMLFGAVPLVVIAAVTTTHAPIWSGTFVTALVYNVVLVNAIGYYLWFFVLRALPAGMAGLGSLVIPVVGVLGAWIQLGEQPGLWEGLGMLFIIGGLALLTGREMVRRGRLRRPGPSLESEVEISESGTPG